MTFGSLFAGIGGFDLGLERAGMKCAWQVEIDDYATKVLEKHWPDVKRYRDVLEVGKHNLEPVDFICGGFPCQPFSTASRGVRIAADLWPEMFRVISELHPRFVIAENVQEKAISDAAHDLTGIGYKANFFCISATDAGADHKRNRWWLCAYADNQGKFYRAFNAEMAELQALCAGVWGAQNYARAIRISNGISNRVDRVRCLGNAVVPQIVEWIGSRIMEANQ